MKKKIKEKYRTKMEDSLITKIQLFLFQEALKDGFSIDEYSKKGTEEIKQEFEKFKLTNELTNFYSSQYFQLEEDKIIRYEDDEKSIKDIIVSLTSSTKYILSKSNLKGLEFFEGLKESYKEKFKEIFPEEDFNSLVEKQECAYCGISTEQIELLGENAKLNNKRSETRGYTLEIDRKLPNLEYSVKNCCMSCYWCNNAKTDEYSPKEFKFMAQGINQIWNDRLKEITDFGSIKKSIEFKKDSKIWEIDFNTVMEED